MPGRIEIATGFVMPCRGTNSMHVGTLGATTESELIVHAVPVYGCVVLAMFIMFWMNRSTAIESVKAAFLVEV